MQIGTRNFEGILLVDQKKDTTELKDFLINDIEWDKSMKSRWTASFGKSYNYSGIEYKETEIPKVLSDMIPGLNALTGMKINNCLINLYHDGKSKMGWHSDNTDILVNGTGVIIVSVGEPRAIFFKKKSDGTFFSFTLEDGHIFYMNSSVQDDWLHSIPENDSVNPRWSLTFREIA